MANTATVLIIEDDEQLQQLYQQTLTGGGYRVLLANSGIDGIASLRDHTVDLVLLDIMLQGKLNGFDVLEQIKRNPQTNPIPVIVLTNLDSESSVAKEIGAAEYLIKAKIAPPELLVHVQKQLASIKS